jgi:hypothetical protein
MKLVGSILILVTALHSQCSGACPIELFLSSMATHADVGTQPPCHRNAENSNQIPDKPSPNNDSCGYGPAIAANRLTNARAQSPELESLPALPVGNGSVMNAAFAAAVFTLESAPEPSLRLTSQKLVLRI